MKVLIVLISTENAGIQMLVSPLVRYMRIGILELLDLVNKELY